MGFNSAFKGLILVSRLRLGLPSGYLSFRFFHQHPVCPRVLQDTAVSSSSIGPFQMKCVWGTNSEGVWCEIL